MYTLFQQQNYAVDKEGPPQLSPRCCCNIINSQNEVRGYRTGSSLSQHVERKNTPGKKHKQTKSGTAYQVYHS